MELSQNEMLCSLLCMEESELNLTNQELELLIINKWLGDEINHRAAKEALLIIRNRDK